MRRNQLSLTLESFGDQAPDGKYSKTKAYIDGNSIYKVSRDFLTLVHSVYAEETEFSTFVQRILEEKDTFGRFDAETTGKDTAV